MALKSLQYFTSSSAFSTLIATGSSMLDSAMLTAPYTSLFSELRSPSNIASNVARSCPSVEPSPRASESPTSWNTPSIERAPVEWCLPVKAL